VSLERTAKSRMRSHGAQWRWQTVPNVWATDCERFSAYSTAAPRLISWYSTSFSQSHSSVNFSSIRDPNDVRRNNPVSLIICTSLHCNASFCRGIKASWRTFVISLALPARSSSDSYYQNTFSPVNNIWSVMIICRRRRKIIRAVRCCIAFGLSYKHSVFFSSLQYIMSRERMIESDSETCQAPSNTEPRSWRCQQINFRWQHVKQWCSRSEYGFRFSAHR